MLEIYGPCEMNIPVPTLIGYFSKALLDPYFLLTYFSMSVWILEGFFLYAFLMINVSFILTFL